MYGAIIGDLAGSIYEYDQLKQVKPIYMNKVIEKNAFYSDDTILTVAILDAILHDQNYEKYLRKYIKNYSDYTPDFRPYFKTSFSPKMIKWSKTLEQEKSIGNGAIMRISPIGHLFHTEQEVIENAKLATIPSHNSNEAIQSATTVAIMIYYFNQGLSKDDVYQKMNIKLEYHPFLKFNTTCYETIMNCLYTLYYSNSFEDAIRKTLLMGGDTDTNCAIVGSIAEVIYGIDKTLKMEANKKLPKEFVKLLKK